MFSELGDAKYLRWCPCRHREVGSNAELGSPNYQRARHAVPLQMQKQNQRLAVWRPPLQVQKQHQNPDPW